ncbi:hypothetical protein PPL_11584 [Heterostelium album PN500]|uniref:Uncharacterized protein n=1 Tax=Heterostelium pallidum (strain ATCC 26659 / Pp 5 / PN500) TaxID=670386 RepID=D3BVJ3_HETP5|nr:hypothetical protein PPL_11584 [Heterostelium album PN500]EFA74616.1 hypothetical protein PPL_11584 [Heterostelium album PN500]|eukprot:XP_020426750.1 hypothetical protein PPL_11584 [Heterostelium album PN500]
MDMNDDDSDNLLINNNNNNSNTLNNSNNSNNNNNNNNNNNLNIDYFKFISNDSKFHQNITARGTLSNNLSKSILRNVENNFNELRNEVDKFDHNLKCNLNKSEIIATKNIISYINSDDFIPNTPSIIIADDVKVLAYTKWRKDIVAILAKRKFTLGTSKLARVEYLVKVGRALAWVPLPGNTLATKFSSAHPVPDPTDGCVGTRLSQSFYTLLSNMNTTLSTLGISCHGESFYTLLSNNNNTTITKLILYDLDDQHLHWTSNMLKSNKHIEKLNIESYFEDDDRELPNETLQEFISIVDLKRTLRITISDNNEDFQNLRNLINNN